MLRSDFKRPRGVLRREWITHDLLVGSVIARATMKKMLSDHRIQQPPWASAIEFSVFIVTWVCPMVDLESLKEPTVRPEQFGYIVGNPMQ